jgi:hypothetical protein
MLLVIGFSVMLLGLALVVTEGVIRQIVPSNRADHSYAALAAAEAGIYEYHKHLLDDSTYYLTSEDNPALTGWVEMPGFSGDSAVDDAESDSEYTLRVDKSRLGSAGELVVYAVGRSPRDVVGTADDPIQVVRTIQAVWSKRSTLDYVYMSDRETPAPDLPGAYSTAANSGGTGKTAQELARLLCSRRFYQGGQVDAIGATGTMRNMNFCQWAGIYNTEVLQGRIHTNDVWRLDTVDLSNSLQLDGVTSSCRNANDGLAPGEVGCGTVRRYIDTSGTGSPKSLYSNNGSGASWSTSTAYQTNAWVASNSSPDPTKRSPSYASVLDLPATPALLKRRAGDTGCVYTGPTRLHFVNDGHVYVTSPDTKFTSAACGGGANGGFLAAGTATAPNTAVVDLTAFEDPVFYVQDVPRAQPDGVDPDTTFAYDTTNQWPSTVPASEPTCKAKFGANIYPFVIPNRTVDTGETAYFTTGVTGSHYLGFPSEFADAASPWYSGNCALGDAYVQGRFGGRLTLATESNIIITGSIAEAGGSTSSCGVNPSTTTLKTCTYGMPSADSDNLLGLVSKKFTYLYRPSGGTQVEKLKTTGSSYNPKQYTYPWAADWKQSNAHNPILNAAILALTECFASQDPYWGTYPYEADYSERNGYIYLWGSLAQEYRCVVGSTGGYYKVYKYDTRLERVVPPAMLELSEEDWSTKTSDNDASLKAPYSEFTPMRQVFGDTTQWWPVSLASDTSVAISNIKVITGNAPTPTTQISGGKSMMNVQPTGPGLVIIRYDILHSIAGSTKTIKESRPLVIWVDEAGQ